MESTIKNNPSNSNLTHSPYGGDGGGSIHSPIVGDGGGSFLNFNKQKVQVITLDQLEKTQQENVPATGLPIHGIAHFEIINAVLQLCKKAGLHAEIYDLFAAQNHSKDAPGVSVYPQLEAKYGELAVEAHVLRRVYANIRLTDFDNEEFTTNLAISYHQKGIEIGMGNCIKICHNQMMLGTHDEGAHYINSWTNKGMFITNMLDEVEGWLNNAGTYIDAERKRIDYLKNTLVYPDAFAQLVGKLVIMRVRCDTAIPSIRSKDVYPLSGAQINRFTELATQRFYEGQKAYITAFDLYDIATELYKPMQHGENAIAIPQMEIPNILSQNMMFAKMISESPL